MNLTVGTAWGIYIVVVVAVLIIGWLIAGCVRSSYPSAGWGTIFFVASLIGALVVFVSSFWINTSNLTSSESVWLTILFLVAFLLPILIVIYMVWAGEYMSFTGEDRYYMKEVLDCDQATGVCKTTSRTVVDGNKMIKTKYK